jgi:hypothetical protein
VVLFCSPDASTHPDSRRTTSTYINDTPRSRSKSQLGEPPRRRHEIRGHLLDRRLDAYADFLSGVHSASVHAAGLARLNEAWKAALAKGDTVLASSFDGPKEASGASLRAANDRVLFASQVIAILAPRETYNAVMKAAAAVDQAIGDGSEIHGPEYDEALRLIKADVEQFTG